MNPNVVLNRAQLVEAAEIAGQIEDLNKQVNTLQERLNGILAGTVSVTAANGKRTLSPKARAKIAAGQVKRWAAFHAAKAASAPAPAPTTEAVAA